MPPRPPSCYGLSSFPRAGAVAFGVGGDASAGRVTDGAGVSGITITLSLLASGHCTACPPMRPGRCREQLFECRRRKAVAPEPLRCHRLRLRNYGDGGSRKRRKCFGSELGPTTNPML